MQKQPNLFWLYMYVNVFFSVVFLAAIILISDDFGEDQKH